ncbi:MAG: hypothetical protein AAGA96_06715 [Verrucomicrobiota bacterium]
MRRKNSHADWAAAYYSEDLVEAAEWVVAILSELRGISPKQIHPTDRFFQEIDLPDFQDVILLDELDSMTNGHFSKQIDYENLSCVDNVIQALHLTLYRSRWGVNSPL